jgi:hypothetical protein
MKPILFITLFFFVACASHTVKMTSDEVQSYLIKTPQVEKSFSEKNGKAIIAQPDYCETLSGPCWKVECIGSAKNMGETECWKSPYEAFGISSESSSQDQTTTPAQLAATCQSTNEDSAKRRTSCFNYFSYLQKNPLEKTDTTNVEKLLKQFCDMKDVACSLQYAKFGKGDLNTDGLRISSYKRGAYQVKSKANPSTVETYEYSILKY